MSEKRALVVTDDVAVARSATLALAAAGLTCLVVTSVGEAARSLAMGMPVALVIAECLLPDGTVLGLIAAQPRGAEVPIIVVAAGGADDLAAEAMRRGAVAVVDKPLDADRLAMALGRVLGDGRAPTAAMPGRGGPMPFLGTSPAIRALSDEVARLAGSEAPLLIHGETGTGKGVLARWIHGESVRGTGPFVDVNCAGLSKELFESELCGFEKGAFTGATDRKVGLIEAANHGTMFLDEIGDLDPAVQPRLLKIIEERRFRRLGSVREQQSDVRFVAASNQDLGQLVREKRFRQDLLFRINTIILTCPPLRDRVEDIPVIAAALLESAALDLKRPSLTITPAAMEALLAHPWPGNIRELQHVIERAALVSATGAIAVSDLRLTAELADLATAPGTSAGVETLEALQLRHIQMVLEAEGWNVERAAQRLGMSRSTLYQRIKTHQLGAGRSGSNVS
jgi:DNA-binding NtrC family response regulator